MAIDIEKCKAKIDAIEAEIQDNNASIENMESIISYTMNQKSRVSGLFKERKLKKLERDLQGDAQYLEYLKKYGEEKKAELQKLRLLLKEAEATTSQKDNESKGNNISGEIIVKVKNADYYDTITIFVDGVSYGKKQGNSTFNISVANGRHSIHGIYDNMESDFEGISHRLGPIDFSIDGSMVNFEVKISNIYSGGKLLKL